MQFPIYRFTLPCLLQYSSAAHDFNSQNLPVYSFAQSHFVTLPSEVQTPLYYLKKTM